MASFRLSYGFKVFWKLEHRLRSASVWTLTTTDNIISKWKLLTLMLFLCEWTLSRRQWTSHRNEMQRRNEQNKNAIQYCHFNRFFFFLLLRLRPYSVFYSFSSVGLQSSRWESSFRLFFRQTWREKETLSFALMCEHRSLLLCGDSVSVSNAPKNSSLQPSRTSKPILVHLLGVFAVSIRGRQLDGRPTMKYIFLIEKLIVSVLMVHTEGFVVFRTLSKSFLIQLFEFHKFLNTIALAVHIIWIFVPIRLKTSVEINIGTPCRYLMVSGDCVK